MDKILLDKIVADRQRKCVTGHIYVDTLTGIARGYNKAKDFHSHRNNQAAETTKNIVTPFPQKSMLDPSGVFNLILKSLGVDYID